MPAITFIGATVAISSGAPATEDFAGFAAKTYTNVGETMVGPGGGDESEDVSYTTLIGRTKHVNGAADGGARTFSYQYEKTDPGQVLIRSLSNTNTPASVRLTFPNGEIRYFGCLVANVMLPDAEASSLVSEEGVFRVNTRTFVSP